MTKTKAKREPTYLLDCVLPPTDVTADGFLAKHRPSIPPEQLLRALLLQVFHAVRSERLLIEFVSTLLETKPVYSLSDPSREQGCGATNT